MIGEPEYRSPKGTAQHELGLHAVQELEKLGIALVWNEPRCSDCEYWKAQSTYGKCSSMRLADMFDDNDPWLPSDFGCCYFTPRKICTTAETSVENHPLCATCGKPTENSLANMGPTMDTLRAACGWCVCEVPHDS